MFFFFKKTKIIVDCFTDEPGAFEFHPIERATNNYPDWWKRLDKSVVEHTDVGEIQRATMRSCDGIISLFKNSWVLKSWTDIRLRTTANEYFYYFGKKTLNPFHAEIVSHNPVQFGDQFNEKIHLKILSPWYLKQNKSCDFAMMPSVWNDINNWSNFTIMPGVGNFLYQHSTNINMFVEKHKDHILIEAGTPFYHIVPLTDKDVVFKNHLTTVDELNKLIHKRYGKFYKNYRYMQKFIESKKTCPFDR